MRYFPILLRMAIALENGTYSYPPAFAEARFEPASQGYEPCKETAPLLRFSAFKL